MEVVVHHAISVDFTVFALFFILEAIFDAFHVEVFGAIVLQIKFAIMTSPVKVNVRGRWAELDGTIDTHAGELKQRGDQRVLKKK